MTAKAPCIYIMTNRRYGTLYIGVTSNLIKRVWQHKNNLTGGFTKRHKLHKLVYYEYCETMFSAIAREKQLKGGSRAKKIALIEEENRDWCDLYQFLM